MFLRNLGRFAACGLALLLLTQVAQGQYNERLSTAGSGRKNVDVSGRSIKNKRVRAIHSGDPTELGTTAYFFERDPFLAYQLGRNLNYREFRSRDGVFDDAVSGLGGPMPDGVTAKITARNHTSCLGCHNLPPGNPGGGTNFHKDSGFGRNAPHYYGGGVIEMLALQIRTDLLRQLDTDSDGWVRVSEAAAGGNAIAVECVPGGPQIDFGRPALSGGTTGAPAFNNIMQVWYVDADGKVVPDATEVDGITTFGYDFGLVVWGWGQGAGRNALNPTNRAFYWDPANAHSGLEAYDPSSNDDPDEDGLSVPTLAGAIQFPVSHKTPDEGTNLDVLGFSRQDPDGDGYMNEISEGDLDLAEWFMLNAPRPAFAGTQIEYAAGVKLMETMACTGCHVPDWQINERDSLFAGDRRLFDLDVTWNASERRLEGRLERLYTKVGDTYVREFDSFLVQGIFTDLEHHDMGEGFREIDFGGNINTLWRTPPLWGVGSGFPWGHDGRSLTLEDAILRHDGEGAAARDAWLAASNRERKDLLEFLRKLVLYDVESLPADIDGDGQIEPDFMVAGRDTGIERFNAEWLFKEPVQIQGPFVNTDGVTVTSSAARNRRHAYGEMLTFRIDSDNDGWPDEWDNAPMQTGYLDGVD